MSMEACDDVASQQGMEGEVAACDVRVAAAECTQHAIPTQCWSPCSGLHMTCCTCVPPAASYSPFLPPSHVRLASMPGHHAERCAGGPNMTIAQ